jgi:uncharacterized glyoxalase superfamily protein PhnB
MERTLEFYCSVLGFEKEWKWGSPVTDAGVRCGDVCLYFMHNPELASRAAGFELMLRVEDVDAAYAEHTEAGIHIHAPIRDAEWGTREYTILDPAGILIRVYR